MLDITKHVFEILDRERIFFSKITSQYVSVLWYKEQCVAKVIN